jgi:hypothetical protein
MSNAVRGARPVVNSTIKEHYDSFKFREVSLAEYEHVWRNWLTFTNLKTIHGLDSFKHADYTQGTSQTFDNFILRHSQQREIVTLKGEFQYHACVSKPVRYRNVDHDNYYFFAERGLQALLISAPFSDFGCMHPKFDEIMQVCDQLDIPVCLDLAYWGISKNVHLDLDKYPAIKEVTCSLSKPFYTLENHRVGIRFTRDYVDDGISMLNEVKMQNNYSMSLGVHYMKQFSPDWNWETYQTRYDEICKEFGFIYTDTVIFGLGDEARHSQFNRGVPGNYRVCISEYLNN